MDTKKKTLLLFCLLLVIPFYLTFIFFGQSSQREGSQLANESQGFVVSVKDGKTTPQSHAVKINFPKSGDYISHVTAKVEEPGFPIGLVINSPSGEKITALTSYGLNELPCSFNVESGDVTAELCFFADRNSMVDFVKNYYGYQDEAQVNDFVDQYDFSVPLADGDRNVQFSITVYEMVPVSIGIQLIPVIIGAILLLLLFLSLHDKSEEGTSLKERMSGVGNCYSIFATAVMLTQVVTVFILRNYAAEFTSANVVLLSLLLTILSVDVIGFPLTWRACRSVPREVIPQKKMGLGKFLLFVMMGAGIVGVGGILGSIVHNAITAPYGSTDSTLSTLMMNSGMFMRVLTVGICAPIFEELVFRKLLVDRLIKYGEFIAILTSGLFFGLFHGNFQQFFFAFGLGCLWAFVYARTGRIRYTIGMHMIINNSTSIVTVYLLQKSSDVLLTVDSTDPAAIMALMESAPETFKYVVMFGLWLLLLVILAIVGLILLIVFLATKKFRLKKFEGEPTKLQALKALFGTGYVWVFLLSTIGLFLESYLPIILG